MTDIVYVQILWDEAIRATLPDRIQMSEEMAEHWLALYGLDVLEWTLPGAVKSWAAKMTREGLPLDDYDYLRNYVMAALRNNRDQKKFGPPAT